MNQTILLIIELILCLSMIVILYKKYKKIGLYAYCSVAFILAAIMSLKTITMYNYDVNLGIIPLVTIFTVSNILIQKYGPEESKTLLLICIASLIFSFVILYTIGIMNPSNINLFASASYDNIFNGSIRIYFALLVTTLYSLLLNINLYYYLKKMKNNILISNLFSTIIIQFIAAILFGLIANIFTKEIVEIIKIIMVRYLVSLCVGIISTSIIYITNFIKQKE